jgi:TolB-like protein/class 3 adenylate cyclase/Flp pilus assembly protein TadD
MATDRVERRLSAILAADVAGYSRLMGGDEEGTLSRLTAHRREVFDPSIDRNRGRLVKTTGDGLLAEFTSVIDAVRCAAEVQTEMANRNSGEASDKRIAFRIRINVGDIVEQDGDIFGDGVNIAARLEGIAEPGGICVSARVQEDSAGRVNVTFEDMGEQALKNIARRIRVFRVGPLEKTAPGSTPLPAVPEQPSIAVLPFENMSGSPEQEYFGDGIAEDIITELSKLRSFLVIARNSSFSYKGNAFNLRQVGRELGVRYILEGSVRTSGERMRVTAQLIEADGGKHLWAERYDRPVADVFAVQDEITASVVSAIEPHLYDAENSRFRTRPTESLDAWGLVVRAMPYIWTWAARDYETPLELLKRAIKLEPNYARAYSLLSQAQSSRAVLGQADHQREADAAIAMARRAIELDPEDAWGHMMAGFAYFVVRKTAPSLDELDAAITRNPNFALAHMLRAAALAYAGRIDESLSNLEISRRLSPRDHTQPANLSIEGLCHLIAGRYADAAATERRAVQLRPNYGTAWRTLSAAAGLASDTATAAQALAEAKRLQPSLSLAWVEQYHPVVQAKDRARYVEGLRKAGLS